LASIAARITSGQVRCRQMNWAAGYSRRKISAAADGRDQGERRVIDLARAPFLHIRHRVTGAVPAQRVAV